MEKKICEVCKKEITNSYLEMMSIEEDDYGRMFYVCKECSKDYSGAGEKQGEA